MLFCKVEFDPFFSVRNIKTYSRRGAEPAEKKYLYLCFSLRALRLCENCVFFV